MVTFSNWRVFVAPDANRIIVAHPHGNPVFHFWTDMSGVRVSVHGDTDWAHAGPFFDDDDNVLSPDQVILRVSLRDMDSGARRFLLSLPLPPGPAAAQSLRERHGISYRGAYEVSAPDLLANSEFRRQLFRSWRNSIAALPDPQGPTRRNSAPYSMRRRELGLLVRDAVNDVPLDSDLLLEAARWLHRCCGSHSVRRVLAALEDTASAMTEANCGHLVYSGDTHTIGGDGAGVEEEICSECFESDEVVLCVDNDRYYWRSSLHWWDSDCEYHLDEEDSGDTESDTDPNRRLDYSVNVMRYLSVDPTFVSSATGDFHMGVELETMMHDSSMGADERVRLVREELGRDYLVGKYDGSLGYEGIEWVTRPTSLATHLAKFGNWTASRRGLKAWDPGCCGLHVHIDSRAFTRMSLGKFLQFFNRADNADFIRGIAGRHPKHDAQAKDYASWDVEPETTARGPLATLKEKAGNASRYRMVNTTNLDRRESSRLGLASGSERLSRSANTVEVRIFRASMKRDRLLSQLEFTHALVVFCRTASYRDLTGSAFIGWLAKYGGQYRNLCRWFGVTVVKPDGRKAAPVTSEPADESSGVPNRVGIPEMLTAELLTSLREHQTVTFDAAASISPEAAYDIVATATSDDSPWDFLITSSDRVLQRHRLTGEFRVQPRDPVTGRFTSSAA